MPLPNQVKTKATVAGNFKNRLAYLNGYLEGLSEDMATAVEEGELDVQIQAWVGDAQNAISAAGRKLERTT